MNPLRRRPFVAAAFAFGGVVVAATAITLATIGPASAAAGIGDAMNAISQIAQELRTIDARLGKIEAAVIGLDKSLGGVNTSLVGIDKSLAPVGAFLQIETLRGLILLATACGAGLIVLHAVLRRWSVANARAKA